MTLKNDRASERGHLMPHPDASLGMPGAPQAGQEMRRERNLRIVHSSDRPLAAPLASRINSIRPQWTGASADHGQARAGTCQMSSVRPFPSNTKSEAILDRALQARIGGMLRDVFSDLDQAPVPDRFVKLLEQLEEKETSHE